MNVTMDDLVSSPALTRLGAAFERAGYDIYVVGGAPRNRILGCAINDIDCTTNAPFADIMEIGATIGTSIDTGGVHGTATVLVDLEDGTRSDPIEITQFRTDTYEQDSRKPQVQVAETIEEDLARRDFTVNAIAVRVRDGHVVDPFDGFGDIQARRLRCPADPTTAMIEDPLRRVRAVRQAVTYDLTIASDTAAAIRETIDRAEIVSTERNRDELMKLLNAGNDSLGRGIELARGVDASGQLFGPIGIGRLADLDTSKLTRVSSRLAALAYVIVADGGNPQTVFRGMKFDVSTIRHSDTVARACETLRVDGPEQVRLRSLIRQHNDTVVDDIVEVAAVFGIDTGSLQATRTKHGEQLRAPLPVTGHDVPSTLKGPEIGAALAAVTDEHLRTIGVTRPRALEVLHQFAADTAR